MAKDRKKLQHMHSSILDKQPTPASLEVGEIAVNNAKDKEFLSIKNSNDKVVRFSSDGQIIEWMERKEVMPYKGYVRGKVGATGTEDDYKSYGITTDDLIRNESNIVIKLNQVAASATTKHDLVNGSKDKYGNLVNPTTDGGVNDGAGFFIDMSRYAMQGANPSFSGITTTCYANLNGTTKIKGTKDSCGSLFEVNVNTINETGNTVNISGATNNNTFTTVNNTATTINNSTTNYNINTANYDLNGSVICVSGSTKTDIYGKETNIGVDCGGTTATTVNVSGTTINEGGTTNNNTFTTINDTTTNYNINTTDYDLNGANICVSGSAKTDIYGKTTNVGVDCGGTTATTVNVSGTTINEGGTNLNQNVTNYDLNGSVICISGSTNSNFYGKTTNVGVDCGGTTATTVNVSGTTINEGGTTNNNTFTTVNNTATTINNKTTNYNITGTTYINGNTTISGTCTIGDTLIVKKGLEKSLSWAYGSVCNEPTSATSTNFKDDARFIIPKTLSDVSCGVVDLTDGCLNINKNICVSGKIEVSNGVFNTSDRRLKENIKKVGFEKMLAARNVTIQQFNYKNSDDNRLTYGIIAQEVQERNLPEIVYINEDGHMSVDYTSLMILKIAYLENEVKRLTDKLGQVLEKLDNK